LRFTFWQKNWLSKYDVIKYDTIVTDPVWNLWPNKKQEVQLNHPVKTT